jgi:glutamate synthase (NADPH/NADH) small chain
MVIEAIGQAPDYSYLDKESMDKVEFVRGKIITDEDGGTDVPWLFAGGDIVHGPDAIHAIADGHRGAKAIDEFLMKQPKLNKR